MSLHPSTLPSRLHAPEKSSWGNKPRIWRRLSHINGEEKAHGGLFWLHLLRGFCFAWCPCEACPYDAHPPFHFPHSWSLPLSTTSGSHLPPREPEILSPSAAILMAGACEGQAFATVGWKVHPILCRKSEVSWLAWRVQQFHSVKKWLLHLLVSWLNRINFATTGVFSASFIIFISKQNFWQWGDVLENIVFLNISIVIVFLLFSILCITGCICFYFNG